MKSRLRQYTFGAYIALKHLLMSIYLSISAVIKYIMFINNYVYYKKKWFFLNKGHTVLFI